jgi:hypothetical protein
MSAWRSKTNSNGPRAIYSETVAGKGSRSASITPPDRSDVLGSPSAPGTRYFRAFHGVGTPLFWALAQRLSAVAAAT